MQRRNYPHRLLEKVRAGRSEKAATELRHADERVAASEASHGRARALVDDHRQTGERVARVERDRLEAGELRVLDIANYESWGHAFDKEAQRVEDAERSAVEALTAAGDARAEARETLAMKRAEEHVIRRHREGWEAKEKARAENEADEEAGEIALSRRGPIVR